MSDYERDTVLERDEVYLDNMRAALRRRLQGKITASEFVSIRARLIENAMRRHRQRLAAGNRQLLNPVFA